METEEKQTTTPKKRLYRSEKNEMIAGVCAGLAEYFEIDPTLIRIAFVLFTLMGGSGVLVYILLWIVMPEEADANTVAADRLGDVVTDMKDKATQVVQSVTGKGPANNSAGVFALLLIVFGVFFLLRNSNIGFGFFDMEDFWPVALIVIGIILISKKK
jgi:phage shock protein C